MKKLCYSCAAREGEAEFPARKAFGERRYCCSCLAAQDATLQGIGRPTSLSRRSWRARERARAASPQSDLVDLISGPAK